MEKTLSLLSLLLLLTGCNVGVEQQIAPPSPDGIEVDHGEVLGRVIFIDENSVRFSTDLESFEGENTYALAEDVVIKVMEGEQLMVLPRERAMEISLSSNSNDYLFYFVLTNDEVLEMTQAVLPEEQHDEATDDLVYVTAVYEKDGKNFITVDPMQMLPCSDEQCPNGFEMQNEEVESIEYEVPAGRTPFFVINWGVSTAPIYPMDFADFQQKFIDEKENFAIIPYHLKVDGQEVLTLTEKYLP